MILFGGLVHKIFYDSPEKSDTFRGRHSKNKNSHKKYNKNNNRHRSLTAMCQSANPS